DLFNNSYESNFPVQIVGSSVEEGNFILSGGNVSYASDTSFIVLNSKGIETVNSQLSFSNSAMETAGEYTLIYDMGGKGYQIDDQKGIAYNGEMEEEIFCADINSDGSYVVVSESSGYLSKLFAFDKNNKIKYKYSFAEYYITDVAINSSGNGAIAVGISTQNGTEETMIYNLDFKKDSAVSTTKISDTVIYDIEYVSGSRAVAIGNNAIYYVNINSADYDTFSYEGKLLAGYDINSLNGDYGVALSKSGDGRNCEVHIFASSGKEKGFFSSEYKIVSFDLYKSSLGIISEDKGYILSYTGDIKSVCDVGNDGRQILLDSEKSGYLLGISEVRKADFKSK
ncbi:MAG: DUF5711 family protein, partial [Acutalibacteraceae bacterium]